MKVITHDVGKFARDESFRVYFLGDCHVGKINCAEEALKKVIKMIADDDNALWIGGGDYLDSIKPSDAKRFDLSTLPDWMVDNLTAAEVRHNLMDMVQAQADRFLSFVKPIKDKCIGIIEGNHEASIMKHHNSNIQEYLRVMLGTENLTDCAAVILRATRHGRVSNAFKLWVEHGFGGGRTAGAEPNKLSHMCAKLDGFDFAARGHSHTFCILSPQARLTLVESKGKRRLTAKTIQAANWGAYCLSYAEGPATYDSRASYPPRPMTTFCLELTPFVTKGDVKVMTVHQIDL